MVEVTWGVGGESQVEYAFGGWELQGGGGVGG